MINMTGQQSGRYGVVTLAERKLALYYDPQARGQGGKGREN